MRRGKVAVEIFLFALDRTLTQSRVTPKDQIHLTVYSFIHLVEKGLVSVKNFAQEHNVIHVHVTTTRGEHGLLNLKSKVPLGQCAWVPLLTLCTRGAPLKL